MASLLFASGQVTEAKLAPGGEGLLIQTTSRDGFSGVLSQIALDGEEIDGLMPTDENVDALYEYLIGGGR